MRIHLLSDPIDDQQTALILRTFGLVVFDTTRTNARAIAGKVESILGGGVIHSSVRKSDGDSYDYLVYLPVMDYDR
jgi:hypothetical protein